MIIESVAPGDFWIELSFPQKTANPQRLFTAAGKYIDSLQSLDSLLIASIDVKLQPAFVLEGLKTGSLKAHIRQFVESFDDEALKTMDWRTIVGNFLVQAKYGMLKLLSEKEGFPTSNEFTALAENIHQGALKTEVRRLPAYRAPNPLDLAVGSKKIIDSVQQLDKEEAIIFKSNDGDASIGFRPSVSQEEIIETFSGTIVTHESEPILMVKKPDFLGDSKWDFKYEKRSISAKIEDSNWLKQFRDGVVAIHPGDALRVRAQEYVAYDDTGEAIKEEITIQEVLGVIRKMEQEQKALPV